MASRNAKGRMVYWKISYCKQLSRCSLLANLLFTWLIPNLDDLGRIEGDIEVIKGMIFPYHKVTEKQIQEAITELQKENLIHWYQYGENKYIQFPNFSVYQKLRQDRTYKSDYPTPIGNDTTSQDESGHDGQKMGEVKVSEGEVKEKISEGEKDTHKFIIPSIEEIQVYCTERKNKIDAEKFFNFYKSKDWMVGKNKMKDWKASVITWEKPSDKGKVVNFNGSNTANKPDTRKSEDERFFSKEL